MRILVVEDDELLRQALVAALAGRGYDVIGAENGGRAMALFKDAPADLVISDVLMPDKDGLELLTELRRCSPTPKFLVISGGGRLNTALFLDLATSLGADRVLAKPFRIPELLRNVAELS